MIATAQNAIELAQKILQHSVKKVIHITSNQRRLELEQSLKLSPTKYQFVELYQCAPTQVQFKTAENLIVFSPIQFDAFRKTNALKPIKRIFCIGTTTQKQVAQYFTKEIIVASKPSEKAMIQCLLNYFAKARTHLFFGLFNS